MIETRTQEIPSPGAPAPTPLESLRRFHFGDPRAAAPAPGADVLPAALHARRGLAVRGGWPVLLDADPAGAALVAPLGERLGTLTPESHGRTLADNLDRLLARVAPRLAGAASTDARAALAAAAESIVAELELTAEESVSFRKGLDALCAALPAGAELVPFGPAAPLALADGAARRRVARAGAAFAVEAQELTATADALLEVDDARRHDPVAAGADRLGALGGRFLDAARLEQAIGSRRMGEAMAPARRTRLEDARARLASFAARAVAPLWVLPETDASADSPRPAARAADPCAAAAALFDRAAAEVASLVAAARLVRLEAADAFDPERHPAWLDQLDWRGFGAAERALVTPVLALVTVDGLLAGGLPALTRLLLSGRPVQVLLLAGEERRDDAAIHFEASLVGLAHRETFVEQASLARPEALAAGLARALEGSRAGLHVVDAPAFAVDGLDPYLVASARIDGRAVPLFRYDPEAGASWARRLSCEENPSPTADWAREERPEGADGPEEIFTFADAMLLDPAWREHYAVADGSDDLVPFAEWLALEEAERARRLPFVAGAGSDGTPVRLVVTRALAAAAQDRLSFWRTLQELGGLRSERIDDAAAQARREADERAEAARAEAAARHREEVERLRQAADAESATRLISALLALGGGEALPPSATPVTFPAAGDPFARIAVPAAATATAAPAAAPPPAARAATEAEEAWIDTALCTSCDECVRKFPAIFVYNGDKQAVLKNARGGTYRDLVMAAEKCTAKIIHPGSPWNPDEPGLATWVERGRAFR